MLPTGQGKARRAGEPQTSPCGAAPRDWPETRTADGRLRLVHGPIDLIFDLAGPAPEVALAEAAARRAFVGVLEALVAELALLRTAVTPGSPDPEGPVAQRMMAAVRPHATAFITPMAAVAGAVADHILAAIRGAADLRRAMVNNGGDIAIDLGPGESCRIGIHDHRHFDQLAGVVEIAAADGIGGVATSGWRGRSHSLGIADAVTVLAATAAEADAAATMIANAVDLPGSPLVARRPARELAPDSDLGDRLVTVGVGPLSRAEAARALDRGAAHAGALLAGGLIRAAFLVLDGQGRSVGRAETIPLPEGDAA
jgi:ApbE superfamily uncharacterized protein (UPF0280 family)